MSTSISEVVRLLLSLRPPEHTGDVQAELIRSRIDLVVHDLRAAHPAKRLARATAWTPENEMHYSQAALRDLMSDISEECWCANWLIDNEYHIWSALCGGSLRYGQCDIGIEKLAQVASLSVTTGSWIIFPSAEEILPGDFYAIPLADWVERYKKWSAS